MIKISFIFDFFSLKKQTLNYFTKLIEKGYYKDELVY
jgi:hypothetical protein